MRVLQLFLVAIAFGFSGLIVSAILDGSFSRAGAWLMSEPWGLVTLADLYLGFILAMIVIWWFERQPLIAMLWILPIPFLGNIWTVIWFLLRLPHLRDRLTRR